MVQCWLDDSKTTARPHSSDPDIVKTAVHIELWNYWSQVSSPAVNSETYGTQFHDKLKWPKPKALAWDEFLDFSNQATDFLLLLLPLNTSMFMSNVILGDCYLQN